MRKVLFMIALLVISLFTLSAAQPQSKPQAWEQIMFKGQKASGGH